MKRIVVLLVVLLPVFAFAQQNNFSAQGMNVIWRKVYTVDKNVSAKTLAYNMRMAGVFRDFFFEDGLITCEMVNVKALYQDLGYKGMSLPIYLTNGVFSGFVTVEYKPDRYRVTINRLVVGNKRLGDSDLEAYALKDDGSGIKDEFQDPAGKILAHTFDAFFSWLSNEIDDEW